MTIDWRGAAADAWGRWRRDRALLLPLAGLFLFLPQFAFYLLAAPFPKLTPEQMHDTETLAEPGSPLFEWMTHSGMGMFAAELAMSFGALALLCLYLDRGDGTPANALSRAIWLFPRYLLAAIAAGLPAGPIGLRIVLLILPCLYLLGRLMLVGPVIVAERPIGVIRAIGRSFALTRRRGFAMMALAAAILLAGMLAPAPFRIIRDALQAAGAENPVAIALTEAIGSLLAAAVALAALLIEIALYRRLSEASSGT